MRIILFGATGMVGQGALRECLLEPEVEKVLAVGRRATGQRHDKLREIAHRDFLDFSAIEDELAGYDACLYCLGVSSAGMSEPDYHRVTYEVTMAAASALARGNPALTSAPPRHRLAHEADPRAVCGGGTALPRVEVPVPGLRDHHGAARAGDDPGGQARRPETRARESGHQRAGRALISLRRAVGARPRSALAP